MWQFLGQIAASVATNALTNAVSGGGNSGGSSQQPQQPEQQGFIPVTQRLKADISAPNLLANSSMQSQDVLNVMNQQAQAHALNDLFSNASSSNKQSKTKTANKETESSDFLKFLENLVGVENSSSAKNSKGISDSLQRIFKDIM